MKKFIFITLALFACSLSKAQELDSLNTGKSPYDIKTDSTTIAVDSIAYSCSELQLIELNSKIKDLVEWKENEQNIRYKLFPTHNTWTFIRLDTRTGQMWQVQYSVEGNQGIWSINSDDLTSYYGKPINGRFTLHQTQNTYNFILLDQIIGTMWQVQWSTKDSNRGIVYSY